MSQRKWDVRRRLRADRQKLSLYPAANWFEYRIILPTFLQGPKIREKTMIDNGKKKRTRKKGLIFCSIAS